MFAAELTHSTEKTLESVIRRYPLSQDSVSLRPVLQNQAKGIQCNEEESSLFLQLCVRQNLLLFLL